MRQSEFCAMAAWCMRLSFPLVMLLVATVAGCGPSRPGLLPAEGIVTLDGKPLADAAVVFQPAAGGRPASGVTDANGRFKVGTFKPRDGALPGRHVVTVACAVETSPTDIRWISPKIYSSYDKSGLSANIAPGSTKFTFDLSSKLPPDAAPRRAPAR